VVGVTPRPGFTPGERISATHWIGGWVGLRAGLDTGYRKHPLPLPGIEPRPQVCTTLYWLSYLSSPRQVHTFTWYRLWFKMAETFRFNIYFVRLKVITFLELSTPYIRRIETSTCRSHLLLPSSQDGGKDCETFSVCFESTRQAAQKMLSLRLFRTFLYFETKEMEEIVSAQWKICRVTPQSVSWFTVLRTVPILSEVLCSVVGRDWFVLVP
jgi:hypothetical protein